MAFKSWRSYWKFRYKIVHDTRYFYDNETMDFLSEVLASSKNRQKKLSRGHTLWRSQLGSLIRISTDENGESQPWEPSPYGKDRMYPRRSRANEGRVNPKGLPYLYLATDKETAMSEARPWVDTEISVGQFKLVKDLNIIDCSINHSLNPLYYNVDKGCYYEPEEAEREKAVWAHIDKSFSAPVVPNEIQADYVPTQVIAELFKRNGFDGISYKSMLGGGHNVALFDIDSAELSKCCLYKTKRVSFEFTQSGNPYVIKDQKNT